MNERRIEELEANLRTTDYIVIKLQEYQLVHKDISALCVRYHDILEEREEWREELNSLMKEEEDEQQNGGDEGKGNEVGGEEEVPSHEEVEGLQGDDEEEVRRD